MKEKRYLFDLDSIVFAEKTFSTIGKELLLSDELKLLKQLTVQGTIEFRAYLRLRFLVLRSVPIAHVQNVMGSVPIDPAIENFINEYKQQCVIATENCDLWVAPIIKRLGCRAFASSHMIRDGQLEITNLLDKGAVVRELGKNANKIIAVGNGFNDIPMFEEADIGVAFGGIHSPIHQLIQISDYVVYRGDALCKLLKTL